MPLLEWASGMAQLGGGIIALWAAWHLRRVPAYRLSMLVLGLCLVVTGSTGLLNVGQLEVINGWRRPLFILERVSTGWIVFQVVLRNKQFAAANKGMS